MPKTWVNDVHSKAAQTSEIRRKQRRRDKIAVAIIGAVIILVLVIGFAVAQFQSWNARMIATTEARMLRREVCVTVVAITDQEYDDCLSQ